MKSVLLSVILIGLLMSPSPSDGKPQFERVIHRGIPHMYYVPRHLLLQDVVAEKELFADMLAFKHFGISERAVLLGVNRNLGTIKNGEERFVGLLLLSPSGMLDTFVVNANSKSVVLRKESIPRKGLREELSANGVLISEAQAIAAQAMANQGETR